MRPLPACTAIAASLALSCSVTSGTTHTPRMEKPGQAAAPEAPKSPEETLPGVDLSGLTPPQREELAAWARGTFCSCGCPHTVSSCLAGHKTCHHAARMVKLASGLVKKGASLAEVSKIVDAYYSGFDRRKRLDVTQYGPPIGDAQAPITFVVISDFTCPFCKITVPTIEDFAKARADRVRLFAKPFPISAHPGSDVAAETAEWAREKGLYWDLQGLLYAADEEPTPDRMAALVGRLGGDVADLRAALQSGRYKQRVTSSQVEARDAGLTGTPTLFLNGRKIEDLTEDGLSFALEDEEEWVKNGGWERD